jgi:hypothetical protein
MAGLDTLMAAGVFSLAHLLAGRLRFLSVSPRSAWLSAAGGSSVAYVFVYILPKLADKNLVLLRARDAGIYGFLEHHAYLVALAGFVSYYSLDRADEFARRLPWSKGQLNPARLLVVYLRVVGFAAYSFLVGYMTVHHLSPGLAPLLLWTVALMLHFLISDHGLHHRYGAVYKRVICWALVVATMAGWGVGTVTHVADQTVALLFAFLAGFMIINVMREELPDWEHSHLWPFLVGAAAYTGLLLLYESFSTVVH